jgi:hypothetical protein
MNACKIALLQKHNHHQGFVTNLDFHRRVSLRLRQASEALMIKMDLSITARMSLKPER